jgi:hypothetical protein
MLLRRIGRLAAALLAAVIASPPTSAADDQPVDLELVLAVDVSMSMDMDEQRLQRDGYVAALRDPEIIAAIRSGLHGRVAVTYVEWAGTSHQRVVVPWTLVEGEAAAQALADKLAAVPLGRTHRTSISGALDFSSRLFDRNGFDGMRRIVDVSGDGANNHGVPVTLVRDTLVRAGISINGLAIMIHRGGGFGSLFDIARLDDYYEACVIGGESAFVLSVTDKREFATAIRRKMILEIAGRPPAIVPAAFVAPQEPIDCLIGEKLWQQWMERQE